MSTAKKAKKSVTRKIKLSPQMKEKRIRRSSRTSPRCNEKSIIRNNKTIKRNVSLSQLISNSLGDFTELKTTDEKTVYISIAYKCITAVLSVKNSNKDHIIIEHIYRKCNIPVNENNEKTFENVFEALRKMDCIIMDNKKLVENVDDDEESIYILKIKVLNKNK
jgi:hypothetical protein